MENFKSKLYKEEYNHIFSKKAFHVRGALVTSAFVEGQVLLLAKFFLNKKGVTFKPESRHEFHQSLNILKVNNILNSKEISEIENFRRERNKAIHGIFKGITRKEWERQNNVVVKQGRPIVKNLHKKLESSSSDN